MEGVCAGTPVGMGPVGVSPGIAGNVPGPGSGASNALTGSGGKDEVLGPVEGIAPLWVAVPVWAVPV
jgi:hypothetical protein